jgi:hypothetical protein
LACCKKYINKFIYLVAAAAAILIIKIIITAQQHQQKYEKLLLMMIKAKRGNKAEYKKMFKCIIDIIIS